MIIACYAGLYCRAMWYPYGTVEEEYARYFTFRTQFGDQPHIGVNNEGENNEQLQRYRVAI